MPLSDRFAHSWCFPTKGPTSFIHSHPPHPFGAADTLPLFPSSLIPSALFIPHLFVCVQALILPGNPYLRPSWGAAWQSCGPGPESVRSEGKGCRREAGASFAKAVIASVVLTSGLPDCCLGWFVIKLIALTSCDAITP